MSCLLYKLTAFLAPDWRRKGIGTAILNWQEIRAREIAKECPDSKPEYLHINATQYQKGLHALACKHGYQVKESWVLMVRPDLDHIPDIPLPEGLEVRPAQPEDFHDIFFAIQEAYVPEGGPPPTGVFPQDFIDSPLFQPELWQVAWDLSSGKVAGSVCGYINHAENKQMGILRGYTEDISTVPSWRKRGVATALIYRSIKAQRDRGMTESALACNAEKQDNYRLYDRCGFKEVKRDTVYRKILGSTLPADPV
jgi:GNAT superfamily N-acetyltransferase